MSVPHCQTCSETEKTETDGLSLREDGPVVEAPVGDNIGPAGIIRSSKISGEVVKRLIDPVSVVS